MGKNAQSILEEFKNLVKETDREKWSKAAENLCAEAYKLDGNRELTDSSIPLAVRTGIAQKTCVKILNKQSQGSVITLPMGKKDVLKIETVEDIQKILHDPSLSQEELETVLDATFFIHEANDKLNPNSALEDLKKRESFRGVSFNDPKSLKTKIQIDAGDGTLKETTAEAEILAERKRRTEEFLASEKTRLDKQKIFKEKSNTKGDLRELEKKVSSIARSKGLEGEDRKKAFSSLTESTSVVGSAIAVGEGLSLYKDGAGFLASKLAKTLLKNGVMKLAEKAGFSAALKVLGTAAGGPIGTILTSLITMLGGSQLLEKGLKYGLLGLGGLALGLAVGLPAAIVLAIAGFVALIGAIATAVGVTIAGAVLGGVVFVSFILFIINSGGYIVPPSKPLDVTSTQDGTDTATFGGGGETDYIRIVKTPSPPGPFATAGTSISYSIEVQAKAVPLMNVRFTYDCYVSFSNLPCPSVTPSIPNAPAEIDPGKPFIIRYTANYPTSYNNSVVVDSLKVTADIPSRSITNHTASGFAAVRFGDPNTRCLTFDNTWLPPSKNVMYVAIAQLMQEKRYLDGLCSGPTITLTRQLRDPGYGGITNQFNITFFDQAFNNGVKSAFYTLAHESGHAFAHVNPGIFIRYVATVPLPTTSDGYICTYPSGARTGTKENKINENFAEATALFALSRSASSSTINLGCLGGKTFLQAYPDYYTFLKNFMF